MVVLNDLDRFHLVMDVIDRVPGLAARAGAVRQLDGRQADPGPGVHPREHGEDVPEIAGLDLAGPRSRDRARGVLVVNAGSSSLKLRVLDRRTPSSVGRTCDAPAVADDAERVPRVDRAGSGRSTPSGTGSCTAGRVHARRSSSTTVRRGRLEALTALAPLHQPPALGGHRGGRGGARPDVPGGGLLRHRVPRHDPAGGGDLRAPRGVARALGAAPLRLPRAVPRVRVAAGRRAARAGRATGAAGRHLPPRRRRVAAPRCAAAARSTPRWGSRRSRGS